MASSQDSKTRHGLSRAVLGWKGRRSRLVGAGMTLALSSVVLGVGANAPLAQAANRSTSVVTSKVGELDCNGDSSAQKSIRAMTCTDICGLGGVGNANTGGGE